MDNIADFYLAGVILGYGFNFAYWQRAYPHLAKEHYLQDMFFSLLTATISWASILVIFMFGGRLYKPKFW